MSNLAKRIISSLIAAPLFLLIIYMGGEVLAAMSIVLFLILFTEWVGLTRRLEKRLYWWLFGFLYTAFAMIVLYFIAMIFRLPNEIFGVKYIPVFAYGVILLVWVNDIAGYFFGKSIGGPKLARKISPNKTWAGAIAGVSVCLLLFFVWNYILDFGAKSVSDSQYYIMMAMHVIIPVLAQIGDLFISYIKRLADVKDSGKILPGHGGLLDRMDGLLLVLNATGIYLYLTMYFAALDKV
jgi:phosphatidate cytidylyltransferase